MVGKGVESKTSRIFHQCYVKCCKLQNLTPISNLTPSVNGKVLDFCVDRIKYVDWPPILNALSYDLSLHSVSIRCRQQVKTVLEQIDCARLAKTVNKRAVILTNFMLTNLIEAITQLLSNTTLLATLLLEGLPLKIPYLNPLTEALSANNSVQHLFLPRSLIGDAGCLSLCKAVRSLPNILTLDLTGCELTSTGATYIAELIKYQKIHRYSENWIHTLRYRMPELDTMAGLRRITLCANPQIGDSGVSKLLEVMADDLWIKALDIQNCGVTEETSANVMKMMQSNTTLVILDLRHNPEVMLESLSKIRAALRQNERGITGQYSWLGNVSGSTSDGRSKSSVISKNFGVAKDRVASVTRPSQQAKFATKTNIVKEKNNVEVLEEQLQDEISHRRQLEELNLQLVEQLKELKQQMRQLWSQDTAHTSVSEQSLRMSSRSSSSGSSSYVPIDQNTLSYIQHAFKDIYDFIKNNQCTGECLYMANDKPQGRIIEEGDLSATEDKYDDKLCHVNIVAKKAQSTHMKLASSVKMSKTTRSAHLLGDTQMKNVHEMKPAMIERKMGDTRESHIEEDIIVAQDKPIKNMSNNDMISPSSSCSAVSESSATLVCSPAETQRSQTLTPVMSQRSAAQHPPTQRSPRALNPREALCSSSEDDTSD